MFQELLESVRQGGALLRGEEEPSRTFEIADPDVRGLRKRFGLSQEGFARLIGISVGTLRNWEQGRRRSAACREAWPPALRSRSSCPFVLRAELPQGFETAPQWRRGSYRTKSPCASCSAPAFR